MSQSTFVSFGEYTESVRVDQDAAPVLAEQLETAAPRDLTHEQKKALADVIAEGKGITEAVKARWRASPAAIQPPRLAVQTTWGGIYEIASGKARLDPSTKVGGAAQHILGEFFADGVPVAQRDAKDTYVVSKRMLELIHDEKLEKTFELVVGSEMLDLARTTTKKLGEAIGAHGGKAPSVPSSTELQERLVRFGRKVGRYCRLLSADVDEEDGESVKRFLDAVRPIDDLRAATRAAGAGDTTAAQPAATNGARSAPATTPAATNGASNTPSS